MIPAHVMNRFRPAALLGSSATGNPSRVEGTYLDIGMDLGMQKTPNTVFERSTWYSTRDSAAEFLNSA